MAPAKSKKTELKVKNDVPKKGRGKGKIVEELEDADMELNDKPVIVNEKKNKRGKKAVQENGDGLTNGDKSASQPKKGKKQETDELDNKPLSYDENESSSDSPANGDKADNGDIGESNGDAEDVQSVSSGKSHKRSTKKDTEKAETKPKASRGKKANKVNENVEKEEKPKANKGRGRKAKVDNDVESDEKVELEEEKPEKATKGRKKGPNKVTKEKTPESEESPEEPMEEDEPVVEESKKKTKRNQGKKTVKDDVEEEAPAPKKRKGNKKEEKVKDESKEENGTDDSVPEPKSKGKRGKKVTEVPETEEEAQDTGETKRRRKPADEKAPVEDKKEVPPKKNKSVTDYESIDFSNSSKNAEGKEWNLKISCWNVDGIRAWLGKGGLDYIKYEKPDILCLQETKCSQEKLPEEIKNLPGYHAYWLCSDKDGYAGVGLYTTKLAMNVQYGLQNEELDNEGRIITAEYEQFYLICTYVPNAGRKLVTLPKRLQWNEEFRKYVKELDKKKPVIICGDMNVAHNEIDLANPKTNKKNAGFTAEERAGMTDLLGNGFVDTFRHFYPDKANAYTFWTYMMNSRAKNVGWRLDYFIVSQRILATICDSVIRSSVYGSDHCPIALLLHLTTADKPKE